MFKGLNLKLTGSFAGYFIVLLFTAGFFLILPQKKFEPYSVTGFIKLEQGEFSKDNLSFSVEPPNPGKGLYEDGRFFFEDLPISENRKTKPSLLIQKEGYKTIRVYLDENLPKIEGLPYYRITYNNQDKIITVEDPIILKKDLRKSDQLQTEEKDALPVDEGK